MSRARTLANLADGIGVSDLNSDAQPLGVNQTWQSVTASRALSTDYTNSTGRPIMVVVTSTRSSAAASGSITAVVGGVTVGSVYTFETNSSVYQPFQNSLTFVVPAGATYRVNGSSTVLNTWVELR